MFLTLLVGETGIPGDLANRENGRKCLYSDECRGP